MKFSIMNLKGYAITDSFISMYEICFIFFLIPYILGEFKQQNVYWLKRIAATPNITQK